MIDRHKTHSPPVKQTFELHWLPSLEKALKTRIGWIDEIVTPFARHPRAAKLKTSHNRKTSHSRRNARHGAAA
jgi:hypothetical protein